MSAICGDFSLNSSANLTDDSVSMNPLTYCGRFAPSPTGPLHAGSLLAAFGSWLFARARGGRWELRIEDVDPPRTVPGAARAQLEALAQLGLAGDGPVLWQSTRGEAYEHALQRLLDQGDAFVCHCSRRDLADSGGVHHACVDGVRRPDPAIRLRVPPGTVVHFDDALRGPQRQDVHAEVGDFVLRRADGCWAYQLAVVVDDASQGVTEVVRGADLLDSTARQIHLMRRLGLRVPGHAHLPLVLGVDGSKLSKSEGASPFDTQAPMALLQEMWRLLGQPARTLQRVGSLDALLDAARRGFDPALVPRHDLQPSQRAGNATMLQNHS